MNLNNDILRYAIPHQCYQCTMNLSCDFACHNKPNPMCSKFIPDNMDNFLNDTEKMILSLIRAKLNNTSLNMLKEYKRIKKIGTIRRGYWEVLKYSHQIEQISNRIRKWY